VRTAAATEAAAAKRSAEKAERDAVDLAQRVRLLSDKTVADLAEFFAVHHHRRLAVPVEEDD
jgi:hypothetical protein